MLDLRPLEPGVPRTDPVRLAVLLPGLSPHAPAPGRGRGVGGVDMTPPKSASRKKREASPPPTSPPPTSPTPPTSTIVREVSRTDREREAGWGGPPTEPSDQGFDELMDSTWGPYITPHLPGVQLEKPQTWSQMRTHIGMLKLLEVRRKRWEWLFTTEPSIRTACRDFLLLWMIDFPCATITQLVDNYKLENDANLELAESTVRDAFDMHVKRLTRFKIITKRIMKDLGVRHMRETAVWMAPWATEEDYQTVRAEYATTPTGFQTRTRSKAEVIQEKIGRKVENSLTTDAAKSVKREFIKAIQVPCAGWAVLEVQDNNHAWEPPTVDPCVREGRLQCPLCGKIFCPLCWSLHRNGPTNRCRVSGEVFHYTTEPLKVDPTSLLTVIGQGGRYLPQQLLDALPEPEPEPAGGDGE